MAINIQYGPISTAMGLAGQAGANQGRQAGFEDDMQLLGYMQRAQQLEQSQRSQEISASMQGQQLDLEGQRNAATQDLARQQLAASTSYRNASLDSVNNYRQNQGNVAQENADTKAQQVQNTGDYQQGRVNIGQQNADTTQQYKQSLLPIFQQNADTKQQGMQNQNTNTQTRNATGQEDADTKALAQEGQALQKYVGDHDRNFGDPNDPDYKMAKQRIQSIQQQMMMRNTNLLGPGVKARPAPAVQQNAQQQQPGSAPSNPAQVKSDADFAQLPHGAYFTGPDGVLRQKP